MESPVNLYKPKELYTATLVSAERLVGPQAHGETCHVVINHSGNVSYISGRIELWCHSFRENPKKHGSPNTLLGMVILLMDGLSIYVFAVLYIMILKLQRKTPQRKVIRAVILLVLEGGLKKQFSDWSIIRSLIASILSATIYALHDSLLQILHSMSRVVHMFMHHLINMFKVIINTSLTSMFCRLVPLAFDIQDLQTKLDNFYTGI
ncbi:hypothetical protein GUJ93_ZPchr0006g42244 [Zizania palustris]|uniref:Uncharacterized protein n=1 Tax=Zizania palustris TaxID=103762 RepID=A0A8J5SUR8_ZIZPA|nr:hypothetical protein GUJ93_ZPchr0006g42244 [Zizania palustris]